jgi:hypothetical protein
MLQQQHLNDFGTTNPAVSVAIHLYFRCCAAKQPVQPTVIQCKVHVAEGHKAKP